MRSLKQVMLWIGLIAVTAVPAMAADSLYHATVPVAGTSAASRNQAIAAAAAAVLVQLSGDPHVAIQPGVATALASAPALVKDYHYTEGGSGALMLDVGFDPQALESLARRLALPVWPSPRPPVLVEIRIDGQMADAAALAGLVEDGAARGVQFILPHAGAPDAVGMAACQHDALAQLARDYGTGLALVGQISGGEGSWTLVTGDTCQSWQSVLTNTTSALAEAGNAAVDRLVARFAAAPAPAGGQAGALWVGHLRSPSQYAAVMALLRSDPRIHSVRPLAAEGDGLLLSLQLDAPLATVAADLAASGHLVSAAPQPGADVSLDWVR